MSAWSWLVMGIGLWVFQSPFTAAILAKWLKNNINNEEA